MPLSEPVDTNPIAKTPIEAADGDIVPLDILDLEQAMVDPPGGDSGALSGTVHDGDVYIAYDNSNPVGSTDEELRVARFDGTTTSQEELLSGFANSGENATDTRSIFFHNSNLWRLWRTDASANHSLTEYDGFSSSVLNTFDWSSSEIANEFSNNELGSATIIALNGNFWVGVRHPTTVNLHLVRVNTAGDIMENIDTGIVIFNNPDPCIGYYNDDLCAWYDDGTHKLTVFDGETGSEKTTFSTESLNSYPNAEFKSIFTIDEKLYATPANPDTNDFDLISLENGSNGENFTAVTGKTIENGTVYSFEFFGPNNITDPTLNDDGQGAFPIRLPGGVQPPTGTVQGNLDLLFTGSEYKIVTLTKEMAQAVYMAEQSALTAQDTATVDTTYGSEEAGVIRNNRDRIAEIQTALQNNGILPTP